MKSLTSILAAGAIFAGVILAQTDDHGANARFLMKTGRDLPGVTAPRTQASCCNMARCEMNQHASAVLPGDAERRFHAKYGRYTPALEARLRTAAPDAPGRMPAPTDAADRFRAKTGRTPLNTTVQDASTNASDRTTMGCCKRHA